MFGRIVIRGGKVCDGLGGEPIARDILVDGGRIADVGDPGSFDAVDAERIDATGLLTAPGFIDAHSHGELAKLKYPENRSKLLQGIIIAIWAFQRRRIAVHGQPHRKNHDQQQADKHQDR